MTERTAMLARAERQVLQDAALVVRFQPREVNLKYELQCCPGPADEWAKVDGGYSLERLRRRKRQFERHPVLAGRQYRIVEVVPDEPQPAKPTIEEKHAAELESLAAAEKRWQTRAKRVATMLKKIRRRKRRLERLYAPKDDA